MRDRVKLRFNLSPFHALARLHREFERDSMLYFHSRLMERMGEENIRVQMATLPVSISSWDVSIFFSSGRDEKSSRD